MKGIRRDRNQLIDPVGYGYVCIPEGVDRSKYIKTCYRKEKISILLDQGGSMILDCYITKEALQNIKFPESSDELGGLVVYVIQKFNSKPIIIGTISKTNESQLLDENTFKLNKNKNDSGVSISGNADGSLSIYVNNKTSGGKVSINIVGEDSELNIRNSGTTNIDSTGDVNVKSSSSVNAVYLKEGVESSRITIDDFGLKYEDENNTFSIDKNEGKIIHHDGSQPILKGDDTQSEIVKLKNYVDTMKIAIETAFTVIEGLGVTIKTPFSTTMSLIDSGDFSDIKSVKSFID